MKKLQWPESDWTVNEKKLEKWNKKGYQKFQIGVVIYILIQEISVYTLDRKDLELKTTCAII